MRLPEAERAIVDIEKLSKYCLNAAHRQDRHKARVFSAVLGIVPADAEWLKAKSLEAALSSNANEGERDDYGTRYILDFNHVLCTIGVSLL